MAETFNVNKVISGNYGSVYINIDGIDTEYLNVKKFEAKVSGNYEDVSVTNMLATPRKLIGYEISGTLTVAKINNDISKSVLNAWKKGIMPEIRLVGKLADPSADDAERVTISGVTFDETDLLAFEPGKLLEVEIPFKATEYNFEV